MHLNVHFGNVSRTKDVQTQIDCAFRDSLLSICSVQNLQKLQLQYYKNPRDPYSDWRRFYMTAYNKATGSLTDKEKKRLTVDIKFVP